MTMAIWFRKRTPSRCQILSPIAATFVAGSPISGVPSGAVPEIAAFHDDDDGTSAPSAAATLIARSPIGYPTWMQKPNHGIFGNEFDNLDCQPLHSSYTGDNVIVLYNNINVMKLVRHIAGMTSAIETQLSLKNLTALPAQILSRSAAGTFS
jgi:hypothetical protein